MSCQQIIFHIWVSTSSFCIQSYFGRHFHGFSFPSKVWWRRTFFQKRFSWETIQKVRTLKFGYFQTPTPSPLVRLTCPHPPYPLSAYVLYGWSREANFWEANLWVIVLHGGLIIRSCQRGRSFTKYVFSSNPNAVNLKIFPEYGGIFTWR